MVSDTSDRAVLVDDDPEVCQFSADVAERLGLQADTAPDFRTFIQRYRDRENVAIVLDLQMPDSGRSQVAYIFGFASKELIQVNVQGGWPVDAKTDAEAVVATANILRRHFVEQGFAKEGLLVNVPISQGNVIGFRGRGANGAMVLLQLASADTMANAGDAETGGGASLETPDGARGRRRCWRGIDRLSFW